VSYISDINAMIVAQTSVLREGVLFAENIDTGSRISGLTRGLVDPPGGRVINVGNCENTHCGVGFGLMLEGVSSVLFTKQLDFMLLGVDHFVSTYNALRHDPETAPSASFTIIAPVCDQGLQGPQSSFNALGDLCSMARVPGYPLTSRIQAEHVLSTQLSTPGFRFIALSQRLWSTDLLDVPCIRRTAGGEVFQHFAGDDATIVSLNFSLPQALSLRDGLLDAGVAPDVFTASYVHPGAWSHVVESVKRTGRLVVLDDSKSVNSLGYELVDVVARAVPTSRRTFVGRRDVDFGVCSDVFEVSPELVLKEIA
jgi:pyruvate/2-oxoglutarate/acetoin dehydrogenase E1 component